MPEGMSRSQLAVYAVVVAAIVVLGARYLRAAPAPAPAPAVAGASAGAASPGSGSGSGVRIERAAGEAAVVHVAGAVRRPGVYRLRPGARVDDAVRRAGGPTRRADLGQVNLAAKVQDGRQVLVPARAPVAVGGGGAGSGAGAATGGTAGVPGPLVNLNTATLEQLDTLPGIGPATAEKILAFRDEQGGFASVEDLAQVPGIGDKRLAALREAATV